MRGWANMQSARVLRRLRQLVRRGVSCTLVLEGRYADGTVERHELPLDGPPAQPGRRLRATLATLVACRRAAQRTAAALALLPGRDDPQSGLAGRRQLEHRLRQEVDAARRAGQQLAVLFIDLDRFKEINDTLGHDVGDQLLAAAAQRIRVSLGEDGTLARLTADEFVVLLPRRGAPDALQRVAQTLLAGLALPFELGPHRPRLSASIGIAVFPHDADTPLGLISCADQAMYVVKAAGRNNVAFFTADIGRRNELRHQLLRDLPDALAAGQFELHYQPILHVASGSVTKAEALLRWRHPVLGMVRPDLFIPLAEETGLIHQLGVWILQRAAATARRWNRQQPDQPRQIGVNLSPMQFANEQGELMVRQVLRASGCRPQHLMLEITEGMLLDDSAHVMTQLEGLRAAGVMIALDDFGTGYSAMSYLLKFKMNFLKIDRSFIRDIATSGRSLAIVEAITGMAHRLGMQVVAEGVETEAQAALLAKAGADYAQGYWHCMPLPAAEFLAHMAAQAGGDT